MTASDSWHAIFDEWHALGYPGVAALFLLAWLRIAAFVSPPRRRPGSARLLSASLLVGFLFYMTAAAAYIVKVNGLYELGLYTVGHVFRLLTHILGILWNLSTVFLVLHWRDGSVNRRQAGSAAALSALGCAVLVGCFVMAYPDSAAATKPWSIADTGLGRTYSSTYAIAMLLTSFFVVWVTAPQIRRMRSNLGQVRLALVALGSSLIGSFAAMRVAFGLPQLEDMNTGQLILPPFLVLVVGGVLYVIGIAYTAPLLAVGLLSIGVKRHFGLSALCAAGLRVFPAVGAPPSLRLRDLASIDWVNSQVLSSIVLLLDVETLLARSARPAGAARSYDLVDAPATDLRVAYRNELDRLLGVARRFQRIRASRPLETVEQVESALREAFCRCPGAGLSVPLGRARRPGRSRWAAIPRASGRCR